MPCSELSQEKSAAIGRIAIDMLTLSICQITYLRAEICGHVRLKNLSFPLYFCFFPHSTPKCGTKKHIPIDAQLQGYQPSCAAATRTTINWCSSWGSSGGKMFASSILGVVSTSTASAWARTLGISGGHNLLLLVKKIIVAILWSLGNYGFCKPMSHRCNSKQPRFCATVGRKCSWTHEMPAFRWKSQWQGLVALVNQNGGKCNGKTVKTKRNWLYTSDSHMSGYAEGLVTSINNVFFIDCLTCVLIVALRLQHQTEFAGTW